MRIVRDWSDSERLIDWRIHHVAEAANKIVRITRQMFSEFGREPTPDEVAQKLQMPPESSSVWSLIMPRPNRMRTMRS